MSNQAGYEMTTIKTDRPKAPKGKAVFAAVTPGSGEAVYRTSARTYTHALAIFRPAEPNWEDRQWVNGDAIPEGFEVIHYAYRSATQRDDTSRAFVGRRVADLPDRWGIVSFNGSRELALKAASQWRATTFRAVPVEIVEDRRGQ